MTIFVGRVEVHRERKCGARSRMLSEAFGVRGRAVHIRRASSPVESQRSSGIARRNRIINLRVPPCPTMETLDACRYTPASASPRTGPAPPGS